MKLRAYLRGPVALGGHAGVDSLRELRLCLGDSHSDPRAGQLDNLVYANCSVGVGFCADQLLLW